MTELIVNAMWSGTDTVTSCESSSSASFAAAAANGSASNGSDVSALAAADAEACVGGGSLKIMTMVITGMFAAVCLIFTAAVCRVVFRLGNKPMRLRKQKLLRQAVAWMLNLGWWACGCWVVAAYGRCMERDETDAMVVSSLVGFGVSWLVMEPLWILLITLAPCLCNTALMNWMNDRAGDIGLDLSLLMG